MASAFDEFRDWIKANYPPWDPQAVDLKAHDPATSSLFRMDDKVYGPVLHANVPEQFRGLLAAGKKVA